MKARKRELLLLVSIGCAVFGTIAAKSLLSSKPPLHASYTIVWKASTINADGTAQEDYIETRYVSSSGNWHNIKQFPDNYVEEGFAEVGRGVFVINKQKGKLFFLSDHTLLNIDPERFRKSSQYVRTETVLGYTTYVGRQEQGDMAVEVYRAPMLNGDMVKHVIYTKLYKRVLEPVSITPGEPAAEKLAHPDLTVDTSVYEQTHGPAEIN